MIITNCPRCGAMNATTTCNKCGWSQFTKSTVSTRITGEIEIMLSGKALLDDYKRLLLENRNLKERVAELVAAQTRWVMASERLPKESGWYIAGLLYSWGSSYSCEVYFDAENIEPRWNNNTSDRIYCWLEGIPELPQPPEVQE